MHTLPILLLLPPPTPHLPLPPNVHNLKLLILNYLLIISIKTQLVLTEYPLTKKKPATESTNYMSGSLHTHQTVHMALWLVLNLLLQHR